MLRDEEAARSKLSAVKDALIKADVHWVVFAGAASHCYGSKRRVTDIDILVTLADLERAKAALKNIEKVDVVADLEIETNQGTIRFFMDEEMIGRTQWKKLLGITVPVIPVEDNVIFKAILQRGKVHGKHDIEDITQMVASKKIDFEYLEKRIEKYHAEKQVKPLLRRLRIL